MLTWTAPPPRDAGFRYRTCGLWGANAASFGFEYGYSVAFDEDHTVGVVQLSLLAPMDVLADRGLDSLVRTQYDL